MVRKRRCVTFGTELRPAANRRFKLAIRPREKREVDRRQVRQTGSPSGRPRRFLNAPDITTTQGLRDQTKAALLGSLQLECTHPRRYHSRGGTTQTCPTIQRAAETSCAPPLL